MFNGSRHSNISCCLIATGSLMTFAFFGLIGSSESASASEGPVAAYSFDAGEGTTGEDITGNEHEGTIEGAEWTNGKYGKALNFDGTSCVSVPQSPELELPEEFTLETWVKPEGSGEAEALIFKESEGFFAYTLFLGLQASGKIEGLVGQEGKGGDYAPEVVSPSPIHNNVWTHVALTYDGAHERLYVNGELVDTESVGAPIASSGPLEIGCAEGEAGFDGKIDEVQIYNRALSAAELAADEATPLQTPQQGPVAAYSFDAGEGTTAEDITGNEHEGTIEGAEWTNGKYGKALSFNAAEGDILTIPASEELELEEFTLEAWVKPQEWRENAPVIATLSPEGHGYALYAANEEPYKLPIGYVTNEASVEDYAYSEEALASHAWTHLAFTDDGAHLRFYVNGELVGTEAAPHVKAGEGALQIGGNETFGEEFFDGKIDEVQIYNRALSGGELAADMATPLQTPQQAPVAAYSFDAGEGTTAEDITGNGHEGTIEGATWTNGKYGKALSFNGSDCVSVPESADLELREELTVEAWVKPEGSGEAESLVFKESEGEFFGYSLFIGLQASGKLEGLVANDAETEYAPTVESPHPISDNVWTHVALTYDGAHERLYVNGELVDTTSAEPPIANSGPLKIGCVQEHEAGFEGKIDELRIYNRALSAGEVAADEAAPIQTPQLGPVAAYSFDEGEGTSAEDVTGNGHTATLEGATWARGKYGDGLQFNGTSSLRHRARKLRTGLQRRIHARELGQTRRPTQTRPGDLQGRRRLPQLRPRHRTSPQRQGRGRDRPGRRRPRERPLLRIARSERLEPSRPHLRRRQDPPLRQRRTGRHRSRRKRRLRQPGPADDRLRCAIRQLLQRQDRRSADLQPGAVRSRNR
jgi:Concanavalin A-like lectin/glucanases superfamily